jgi:hypothetical protein
MAGSQVTTSVSIIQALNGWQALSLGTMDTSAASFITAGSRVEIASAFFLFATDDTPQATTWTAITTGQTAYISLTPSGTAGSQVVTSKWTDAAPVWSDSKQAWYASAGSSTRIIGGCYKSGATSYNGKFVMQPAERTATNHQITLAGGTVETVVHDVKMIAIGDWDMDASVTVSVAHGLPDFTKIRNITGVIRADADNFLFTIPNFAVTGENDVQVDVIDSTTIYLDRRAGGRFDATTFNSVGFNRGFLYLDVERS